MNANQDFKVGPTRGLFDLTGRGVGLTGGGGHLGSAMAHALAAHGATVMIMGRTIATMQAVVDAAADLPGDVFLQPCDVSQTDDIDAALSVLAGRAGAVHGWINNAYSGSGGRLLEVTREQAEMSIAGGLTNVLMATQRVAAHMVAAGTRGSIVNVSSMYGIVSPDPGVYTDYPSFHNPPAYGAAKAGMIQLSRYAACDLGAHGVRVNSLSPGPFPSPPVQAEEGFIRALDAKVPLGRIGRPEELGGAAVFLISDAASYVTGHNLVVDGGWTAW